MAMPVTLSDWLGHLENLHPKTIALGLERVVLVKQRLQLEPPFPVITVGGTNGKGSVCAMLESLLQAAGYRTGCYTSPHLLEYNERVRLAGQYASDANLCNAFEEIERARGDVPLTYFEFGTLAAMHSFMTHSVDVVILEVGLGGRLDAVNAFDADCAVVASVDIDHTDYLGSTRELIAFEKAGIFRKDRVAVFGDPDMPATIAAEAQRIGAELWRAGEQFSHVQCDAQQWNYRGPAGSRNALPYPALRGTFQLHNASAALAALDALKERLPVSMGAVRRGLTEVMLAGRFQVVPGRPAWILDVAHNPHAARRLAENLARMPCTGRTLAVFAMLGDKDIGGVADALAESVDEWLVAGINVPRGASAARLVQALESAGVRGRITAAPSLGEAARHAASMAAENDRIVAFGSFHTVAEVMRARGLSHGKAIPGR